MAGSASTALRRHNSKDVPIGRRLGGHPHRSLPPLRAVGVDTLGFDPRQNKDALTAGQQPPQVLAERGSALAQQQCLGINLINLLQQVLVAVDDQVDVDALPPADDLLRREDGNILSVLESRFASLNGHWVKQDRHRRLPGLNQLFAVAHERPLVSRRALRAVYEESRLTRPWMPHYDLGSWGRGLLEVYKCAEQWSLACPGLSLMHGPAMRQLECSLPKPDPGKAGAAISVEEARKALLEGNANAEAMRVLRAAQDQHDGVAPSDATASGSPPKAGKGRRKSSGRFFTWGDCVMPKTRETEESADDLLMADLTATADDEESKAMKKKAHGGRKRRMSTTITDEVEPTPVVDDKGVFHFGDFAVDTTGGYDYGGYGSGAADGAAGQFAFGDFAIGLDEEMIRKHEPEKIKKKQELSVPKKEPKPGGLRIVNYRMHNIVGHAARVKCIAVSPNEENILSCSHEDLIVVMTCAASGREVVSFSGHDDTLTSVAFSADQKHVATTSRDQNLILWDAVTAKVLLQFEHEKVVICCAWSKNGRFIVSGCQDKVCRVWDTKKGKEKSAFTEHTAIIISLDFSPDDKNVVSASADKTVRIWTASNGQPVKVLKGHTGIVLACRYLPDGKQVLSNDESEVKLWDVKTGACKLSMHVENIQMALPSFKSKKRFTWTLCAACPGDFGNYIIASCNLRTVIIFERQTGEEVLTIYTRAPVYCLASSCHSKIVLGDSMGNVYIVNLHGV
eukprot:TRINITY_DN4327_c0_g1_i1.p1 TRINITY_DN4327_c0_g1~~TRINITY_DN4327_c0_g1_i1.p1  ORF type:complete len:768 (+),score=207.92 TRINITY_DN4327_c0_g1_i1:96-2306(+)